MATDANIVVIGAGIIGTSVAYHLADLGVDGVVVVDKGDLDHNDGSTSHAPGGLRTLTGSHFFTTLGRRSRDLYDTLPLADPDQEQFWRVGMVGVATTAARLDAHRRLVELGLSEGLEASMLDPGEGAERVRLLEERGADVTVTDLKTGKQLKRFASANTKSEARRAGSPSDISGLCCRNWASLT